MRQKVRLPAEIILLDVPAVQLHRDVGGRGEVFDGSPVLHEVGKGGETFAAAVAAFVGDASVGGTVDFEEGDLTAGGAGDGDGLGVALAVDEVLV